LGNQESDTLSKDPLAAWALGSLITFVLLLSANSFAYSVLHIGVREDEWFSFWTLTGEYLAGYWAWPAGRILFLMLLLNAGVTLVSWHFWMRPSPKKKRVQED